MAIFVTKLKHNHHTYSIENKALIRMGKRTIKFKYAKILK